MTKELENKFLKQLTTDNKLQDALAKAKSPEEAHKVVVKAGFDVKLDEFKNAMKQLNAAVNQKSGELSENDLEKVAGGRGYYQFPGGPGGPGGPIGPGGPYIGPNPGSWPWIGM